VISPFLGGGFGSKGTTWPHVALAAMAARVNDLLLPVVKGVGSEQAYAKLTESLQTFGGSGFLQDYPIEQYIRDAKIDSLYEGTTAIQAQDFAVVRSMVFIGSVLYIVGLLLTDLSYTLVDPRIKLQ